MCIENLPGIEKNWDYLTRDIFRVVSNYSSLVLVKIESIHHESLYRRPNSDCKAKC